MKIPHRPCEMSRIMVELREEHEKRKQRHLELLIYLNHGKINRRT